MSAIEEFKEVFDKLSESVKKPTVAIVSHVNPDPDAIGAMVGMGKIIQTWNPDAECMYLYNGEISHPQNKTLVNLLGISMTHEEEIDFNEFNPSIYVVVDTVPERSLLPSETNAQLTVDHHRNDTSRSDLSDIREVGSASSMVYEYMEKLGIGFNGDEWDSSVATAMIIGIKTDTSDLASENVTNIDFEAFKSLLNHANRKHLASIIDYPIPPYYFPLRSELDKEENIKIEDGVLVGGIGCISPTKRDALPMMAEERVRTEGVETAFVFGVVGNNIEVSVRSVGDSVDVNERCRKIFGKEFAGGKMGAGGAKIPLGFLGISGSPKAVTDKMWDAIRELVIDKILHVMKGNE